MAVLEGVDEAIQREVVQIEGEGAVEVGRGVQATATVLAVRGGFGAARAVGGGK
jgi:hypothetical protein